MLNTILAVALFLSAFGQLAHADKIDCKKAMRLQDEGMWVFNNLPKEHLKKTYNFNVTPEWTEHIMKSSVRFNTGGSGSWVSANGLLMTNHHVAAPTLHDISTPENDYLEKGYYATTPDKEIKAKNLEINQLVSIEDVSTRVLSVVKPGMSPGEAKEARTKEIAKIEKEESDKTGLRCDVVPLYLGGQYHVYRYKKYTDIRLVFAPEKSIAAFGGDVDNFEFPRYDLDGAFFRAYENDQPAKIDNFFTWKSEGAQEDELVFVSGNPGSTKRMYTADHMIADRDVTLPVAVELINRRIKNLEKYMSLGVEQRRQADHDHSSMQNSIKVRNGELTGLRNTQLALIDKKKVSDLELKRKLQKNPEFKKYLSAWGEISKAEDFRKSILSKYRFLEGAAGIDSELFTMARHLVRIAAEDPKQNSDRLPEYQASRRDSLVGTITSSAPIYKEFEQFKIVDSLKYMLEKLGATDPLVQSILQGKTPEARAAELVSGTSIDNSATRAAYIIGGQATIDESTDPFILLAKSMDQASREIRKMYEDKVSGPEDAAYEKIAAARFAIEGTSQYPDATFSPRLSFGRVQGYNHDGQDIKSHTVIGGAFDREIEMGGTDPFKLPETWKNSKSVLNLDTPFNQVSTADIIGGNSGSPLVNRDLQIVGLIFDGNHYSHIARYAYTGGTTNPARAVAVHSAAILHSLDVVYKAEPLVNELLGKKTP